MVRGVSKNIGQGGRQLTPPFHRKNVENYTNLPLPENEDKVQIVMSDKFPFLHMKINWSPEGGLKTSVFRENGHIY